MERRPSIGKPSYEIDDTQLAMRTSGLMTDTDVTFLLSGETTDVTTILIGLGEYAVTDDPTDCIKTLGLGSCVAVCAIHSKTGAIGMVHIVMPDSKANPPKANRTPGYFADTAITKMFEELNRLTNSTGRYIVKMAGGAAVLTVDPADDNMNIGKRNILATKKALWKRGLGALAEDVGGSLSRSVRLDHGKPKIEITIGGKIIKAL